MEYHLPERVLTDIKKFALANDVEKVILFGSRARRTNKEKSDIDIAVSGGDYLNFYYDIEEKADTLLMFDVINLDEEISAALQKEIERDGIIIYEKI